MRSCISAFFPAPAPACVAAVVVLLTGLLGCHRQDEISSYQVDRPAPPHRMLAAIVPHGDQDWFFKVTGPNATVAEHVDAFSAVIKSLRFAEGEKPEATWDLPEGWTQEAGSGMRYATLMIPTDEQDLELTVTPLPKQPSADTLANVNRWRGQLGLAPLDESNLAQNTESIDVAGETAVLVDLVGKSGSSPAMTMPPAGRGGADPEAVRAAHAAAGIGEADQGEMPAAPPSTISFQAPDNWKPGQRVVSRSAFAVPREAAFNVTEDGKTAEITVTSLGAGANNVLQNVNRWRGQVGLDDVTEAELAEERKTIDMNGVEGEYFRLIGPTQAILGVIALQGDKVWFVKLQGDHDLAIKLQEDFEAFTRSIKF